MVGVRTLLLAVTLLVSIQGIAQDFDKKGSEAQLKGLSDLGKVEFINKNFYKLYSADFDNAKELTSWAGKTAHHNHWAKEEGYARLNQGVITYLSGDYTNVLPSFFRALAVFDSIGDKRGLAALHNEMYIFYNKQKDSVNAIKALDVAEKYGREVNDLEVLGTTLNHRGWTYVLKGQYDKAEPYYKEVLGIRQQTHDSVGLGYIYLDLAEVALHRGKVNEALNNIDISTVIRKKIGDKQGTAVNFVNKGEALLSLGRYKEALGYFQEGLKQGKAIGFGDLVRHTYDYIAQCHLKLGQIREAYDAREQWYAMKDSLFNIERTKVIGDLQTKYETEKKNQQIVFLNQENELKTATIERNYLLIGGLVITLALLLIVFYLWRNRNLQRQEAILQEQKVRLRETQISAVIESQELERKRFATDLHDGMGQMISALSLNIQSLRQQESFEKRDQLFESSDHLLSDIHDEIRNIAFNLMPPVLVKEGLFAAIQELVRKINKSGKIKVVLSVFDVKGRFNQVTEISLYRVVQEFLSNIMKYANATEVTISFTGYDNEIVLTIEDNGIGYDIEKFKSSDGNGWRNVNSRINLIKGSIELDTALGRRNSTVIINIPVSHDTVEAQVQNTERPV